MNFRYLLPGLLLSIGLGSAQADDGTDPSVLDDDWHMIAFAVEGDEEDRDMVPIFSIRVGEDRSAGGMAACNRWQAQANFPADGKLRFEDFSETRSVCRFNDIVARTMDNRFTDRLRNLDIRYRQDGDRLLLEFEDGERWTFEVLEREAEQTR